jgi:hypothetical protein
MPHLEYPYRDACWSKPDLEELSRQYTLAQDIWKKASELCEWLEENPLRRFSAIVRLWNACVRDTPQRDTHPKETIISASQFLDGVNFGELFGRHIALPPHREEETP